MVTGRLAYFVSTESQPRVRRAADVTAAAVGALLVVWGAIAIDRQTPWARLLTDLLMTLPSWASTILALAYALGFLYGIGIVAAMAAGGPERRSALRDVLLATGGASVVAAFLAKALTGSWPYILPEIGLEDPDPQFPVLRVVAVTAVLVAASPHLGRPMRRLGWYAITLTALAAVGLGYGTPSDAVGAIGVGLMSAGVVLVAFGSPRGYPDPQSVAETLGRMGALVTEVGIDPEQSWGVRRLRARTFTGEAVAIKAYGRDASDSQWMAKVWRTLWYREDGRTIASSRLQMVEHEALVTMLAARADVRVPQVIAAGETSNEVALLVVSDIGERLDELDPGSISDELTVEIWRDVARLHAASISHGSLDTGAIRVGGGRHGIGDFARGSLVADESDRAHDIVELLFSLSLLIGAERVVRTARAGLGDAALIEALPYLQQPAVSRGGRRRADDPKVVIKELQEALVAATGQPLPEPVKLRRVSGRDLLMTGLLVLAAWAFIPMIAGIDFEAVWEELQGAAWGIIVLALFVGHAVFVPEATGMMFAVAQPLPFWPLVTLQVASKFVGLAVPSVAGRIAMNAAFLRKFGAGVAVAITQGAIDGFSGFVVEGCILLVAFLSADFGLGLEIGDMDVEWGVILGVLVLVGAATVVAVLRIKRLKEWLLPVIRQGWSAMVTVARQPSRALGLLGSNLAARLVMATVLWLALRALGVPFGFGGALAVVVATNLLQGLVPIPGGVGVSEAAMTGFLVALGVEESTAFAATIVYRAITFYLPAVEGFPAMRWLERNEYL